jgi:hypothetical protein
MAETSIPTKTRSDKGQSRFPAAFVVAMSHPIKVRCLTRMARRPTSAVAIAREFGEESSNVAYHIRKLEEWNLVECVGFRPVRGSTEKSFRTVDISAILEDDWGDLPLAKRRVWIETAFSFYGSDLLFSLEEGTLAKQDDLEISRTSFNVDDRGWADLKAVFVSAQEKVEEIKAESETRIALEEATPRPVLSYLSVFDMPPEKKRRWWETTDSSAEAS